MVVEDVTVKVGAVHSQQQVVLVYASQTGNAQGIAEELCGRLGEAGVSVWTGCVSHPHLPNLLCHASCLVLVASTTGDGEPPDTAQRFWKHLRHWSGPALSTLSYTVLGLGDTNYNNFCNFGKSVDQRLQDLGAHRFYRCGWADDGTGLEVVVEAWCDGLESAIKTHLSESSMREPPTHSSSDPHPDTQNGLHGGESTAGVPRSDGGCEEPHHDQGCEVPLPQDSRGLEVAIAAENEEAVSQIIAQYNIEVLPQSEMECLPLLSCAFLQDHALSLPAVPPPYLAITFTEDVPPLFTIPTPLPAAAAGVVEASVHNIRLLTHPDAVKTTLEYTLNLPDTFAYQPGDCVGLIARNSPEEVELVLRLLGFKDVADKRCELSLLPGTKKRAASVPSFLPHTSCLRHLLEHCVDIRAVPKKPFLRALAEYTSKPCEQRRLLELVSREGTAEYSCHVREAALTTLDLLMVFRSCRPPITVLLENLPRLLPRPYSIASSQLATPSTLSFIFNIIKFPRGGSVTFSRQGVCTGWLAKLACNKHSDSSCGGNSSDYQYSSSDIEQSLSNLSISSYKDTNISIYLRTNNGFRPPADSNTPVIMVGPGTGVAPFIGFLQHREHTGLGTANWWLFHGCRNKDQDYLYRTELEEFRDKGVLTELIVSYSRDGDGGPKYVQDSLVKHGASVAALLDRSAVVYVCGDAQNMAKDVFEAFVCVLSDHKHLSEAEARKVLAEMQLNRTYLQDVWT